MRFVFFYHSLISDWNHGNAHFLRGVATELQQLGHGVRILEPAGAWSVTNLLAEHGEGPIQEFQSAYPHLQGEIYDPATVDLAAILEGADVVLVHEWNDPSLVARIGELRRSGRFRLFFHDTHHRAISAPEQMQAYDLTNYDGVLVFGEVLRRIYAERGWSARAWTWHEAADIRIFHPPDEDVGKTWDLVWVGNWGDDERSRELHEFLLDPVADLGLRARIFGVRYPPEALAQMSRSHIEYSGWIANFRVPSLFATASCTVHVPRRFYVQQLPGIPTIRVFEALACRIPLICAPWDDSESLFSPGRDYLVARNGSQMREHLRLLRADPEFARRMAEQGVSTIRARHTCAHRARELLTICEEE